MQHFETIQYRDSTDILKKTYQVGFTDGGDPTYVALLTGPGGLRLRMTWDRHLKPLPKDSTRTAKIINAAKAQRAKAAP